MMMIRPIETRYADHRFRSRLEARWAVFFDHLGIKWEYEPEGYVINGRPYLPDFKLALPSDEPIFAEVKPSETDEHEGEHIDLCRDLAYGTGRPVLLLVGVPAYRMYHRFTPTLSPTGFIAAFFTDYGNLVQTADNYWLVKAVINRQTGAMEFPGGDRAARKSFGRRLVAAVKAARSARFEHGEQPDRPLPSTEYGTAAWSALPDNDPRKLTAVFQAADNYARYLDYRDRQT